MITADDVWYETWKQCDIQFVLSTDKLILHNLYIQTSQQIEDLVNQVWDQTLEEINENS
jgi:hypothetical protein